MEGFDDFFTYEASLEEMVDIPRIISKLVRMGLPDRYALAVIKTPDGWIKRFLKGGSSSKSQRMPRPKAQSKRLSRLCNSEKSGNVSIESLLAKIDLEKT